MTDTEIRRREAICKVAGVSEIDDLSDGFHTFRQLYYQRMMLFATIVKQNKDRAWKSLRHEDGELCFGGGWFIVGVDTPEGSYTYHYEDNYYSLFDCEELECGKHWDGHTEKDVTRLLSLPSAQPDIDSAYSEGYTAAESKYRKMWDEMPKIIRCRECKHWRQQTNYQGALLSFGCCESEDMWESLYGETTEVEHIDTDDNHYCGYAERRTDEGD